MTTNSELRGCTLILSPPHPHPPPLPSGLIGSGLIEKPVPKIVAHSHATGGWLSFDVTAASVTGFVPPSFFSPHAHYLVPSQTSLCVSTGEGKHYEFEQTEIWLDRQWQILPGPAAGRDDIKNIKNIKKERKKSRCPQRPKLPTQIAATPSAKRNTQIESGKMAIHARVVGNPFDCGHGAITLIGNQIIGQCHWSSDSHSILPDPFCQSHPPSMPPPFPAPHPPHFSHRYYFSFLVAIQTWY